MKLIKVQYENILPVDRVMTPIKEELKDLRRKKMTVYIIFYFPISPQRLTAMCNPTIEYSAL